MSITSTVVDRAEIAFHEAPDVLRSFVGCFWVVTAGAGATIRLVPDGSTAIAIQLQTSEPSRWILRGPLVRPEERRYASPSTVIGVRLRPGVAFMVSGLAAHTIVGRHLDLRDAARCRDLVAGESSLSTPAQCIDALQRFLIRRLQAASLHGAVATAIREIERDRGCVRVADVAARCRVSPRQLNRLMRIWVGYGPKRFARIVRFQEALNQMAQSPDQSGAALASGAGYFDQAHLTLDVTRLAGATPGRLTSTSVAGFSKTYCDDLP